MENSSYPPLWPDASVLSGSTSLKSKIPPWGQLVGSARSVSGVLPAVSGTGVTLLEDWVAKYPTLKLRLVIPVYPTCATVQRDLVRLLDLQTRTSERVSFSLLPLRDVTDRVSLLLCFVPADGDAPMLLCGASESPRATEDTSFGPVLALVADSEHCRAFLAYLSALSAQSLPLGAPGVVNIPELELPKGPSAGAAMWSQYRGLAVLGFTQDETGGAAELEQQAQSLANELGVPVIDAVSRALSDLYKKGSVTSIDKASRMPPLDAPINPEWFSLSSTTYAGALQAKLNMRVSPFDEHDLRRVEKVRSSLRETLTRFTYRMADNIRWMPESATALFQAEVARLELEGHAVIDQLIPGDIQQLLATKRNSLSADATTLYQKLGGQGVPPEVAIHEIMGVLHARLTKATSVNVIPTVSRVGLRFDPREQAGLSPWGQALSLLLDIARFARKSRADAFYFYRGLRIDGDEYLRCMDVAEDAVYKLDLSAEECRSQLQALGVVEAADLEAKDKCERVLAVIHGDMSKAMAGLSWQPTMPT